jgi:hypothetical protein
MAIWQTCRFDREEHKGLGWIGRALDSDPRPLAGAPGTILVGRETPPIAIRGRRSVSAALADLNDYAVVETIKTSADEVDADQADDITAFVRRSALDAYTTADRLKELSRSKEKGLPQNSWVIDRCQYRGRTSKRGLRI